VRRAPRRLTGVEVVTSRSQRRADAVTGRRVRRPGLSTVDGVTDAARAWREAYRAHGRRMHVVYPGGDGPPAFPGATGYRFEPGDHEALAGAVRQVLDGRDRRRTTRRRLEDVFDRRTFTSMPSSERWGNCSRRVSSPPSTGATVSVERLAAWTVVFAVSLVLSVRWERVADTAAAVGNTVEESTDPEGRRGVRGPTRLLTRTVTRHHVPCELVY